MRASIGIKLSCKVEASSGGTSASVNCDDSSLGGVSMSSTDIALLAGGGVAIASGRGSITLEVRYALGLQNIAQDANTKNRGITLGLAYMVPLGR